MKSSVDNLLKKYPNLQAAISILVKGADETVLRKWDAFCEKDAANYEIIEEPKELCMFDRMKAVEGYIQKIIDNMALHFKRINNNNEKRQKLEHTVMNLAEDMQNIIHNFKTIDKLESDLQDIDQIVNDNRNRISALQKKVEIKDNPPGSVQIDNKLKFISNRQNVLIGRIDSLQQKVDQIEDGFPINLNELKKLIKEESSSRIVKLEDKIKTNVHIPGLKVGLQKIKEDIQKLQLESIGRDGLKKLIIEELDARDDSVKSFPESESKATFRIGDKLRIGLDKYMICEQLVDDGVIGTKDYLVGIVLVNLETGQVLNCGGVSSFTRYSSLYCIPKEKLDDMIGGDWSLIL